jgi:hypothetical protein
MEKEKRYKPFHEYSKEEHRYMRVEFTSTRAMEGYISKFNEENTLRINTSNSYLADDEK